MTAPVNDVLAQVVGHVMMVLAQVADGVVLALVVGHVMMVLAQVAGHVMWR
jgi:hypothetical protein